MTRLILERAIFLKKDNTTILAEIVVNNWFKEIEIYPETKEKVWEPMYSGPVPKIPIKWLGISIVEQWTIKNTIYVILSPIPEYEIIDDGEYWKIMKKGEKHNRVKKVINNINSLKKMYNIE